tara:strand:- start:47 stop:739 length:693 start_codon:yes stop_codon:yes gene_type:complete
MHLNPDRYANQISYKIKNSRILNYPYPHAEVADILPTSLLDALTDNFPKEEEFISTDQHPYRHRNLISLTNDDILRIKEPRSSFWKFFREIMISPIVVKSLLSLYNQEKEGNYYPTIMVLHDKKDYSLGPHTDIPSKVISLLIYLSSNSYGTYIYAPKINGFTCETGRHYKRTDFHDIYKSNFKLNNSFSFLRTDHSFHGVEPLPKDALDRKLINYFISKDDNDILRGSA